MKKVVKKKVAKSSWKSPKKDQYTVVLEDLRSNFRAFGENLDFVRTDVAELKITSRSHTEMIGRIMIELEEIKSGMREKVDRKDFDKLEKRMVLLETAFFTAKHK